MYFSNLSLKKRVVHDDTQAKNPTSYSKHKLLRSVKSGSSWLRGNENYQTLSGLLKFWLVSLKYMHFAVLCSGLIILILNQFVDGLFAYKNKMGLVDLSKPKCTQIKHSLHMFSRCLHIHIANGIVFNIANNTTKRFLYKILYRISSLMHMIHCVMLWSITQILVLGSEK